MENIKHLGSAASLECGRGALPQRGSRLFSSISKRRCHQGKKRNLEGEAGGAILSGGKLSAPRTRRPSAKSTNKAVRRAIGVTPTGAPSSPPAGRRIAPKARAISPPARLSLCDEPTTGMRRVPGPVTGKPPMSATPATKVRKRSRHRWVLSVRWRPLGR